MNDRERMTERLKQLHRDLRNAKTDNERRAILHKIDDCREILRQLDQRGGLPQTTGRGWL